MIFLSQNECNSAAYPQDKLLRDVRGGCWRRGPVVESVCVVVSCSLLSCAHIFIIHLGTISESSIITQTVIYIDINIHEMIYLLLRN